MLATCKALSPLLYLVRGSGGALDTGSPHGFLALCDRARAAGAAAILIDLGAPGHCSQAGLAGLVEICSRLGDRVHIGLCNPGTAVTAALAAHGLDRALKVFATVEAARDCPPFRQLQLAGLRAVVLCAGTGSRMQPMTRLVPKPMLDIAGQPVLGHILAHLDRFGLNDIALNPGYLGPQIPAYFRSVGHGRQSLHFFTEGRQGADGWQGAPLGSMTTLARLGAAHAAFHDDTFVLCGDALIDIDFAAMLAYHRSTGASVTIAAQEVTPEAVVNYGILATDSSGRITSFQEKPRRDEALSCLANTGIYLFRPEVLDTLAEVEGQDIARDLFPALLRAGLRLQAFGKPFRWTDIGCGRDYYRAVAQVLERQMPLIEPTGTRMAGPVWTAAGAQVSPDAEIGGPCHIGAGARIEAGARIIGPCAIGAGAVIEGGTLVRDSLIWAETRVTRGAWVDQMIAGADWAVVHHYADGRTKPALGLDGLTAVAPRGLPTVPDGIMVAS